MIELTPMRKAFIKKYQTENPGISDEEAYGMYKAELRRRASEGGRNNKAYPFQTVPGLAQRAARSKKKKNV